MVDIFDRIHKDSGGPIGQYLEKAFGYYMYPRLEGELGPHMVFNGIPVLNWSLNNYLGLANHPAIRKADAEAAAGQFTVRHLQRGTDGCSGGGFAWWNRVRNDPGTAGIGGLRGTSDSSRICLGI